MRDRAPTVDQTPNPRIGDLVRSPFMGPGVFGIVMGLDARECGTVMVNVMWYDSKGEGKWDTASYIEDSWLWTTEELLVISQLGGEEEK